MPERGWDDVPLYVVIALAAALALTLLLTAIPAAS
jgi:hypothetical protein